MSVLHLHSCNYTDKLISSNPINCFCIHAGKESAVLLRKHIGVVWIEQSPRTTTQQHLLQFCP